MIDQNGDRNFVSVFILEDNQIPSGGQGYAFRWKGNDPYQVEDMELSEMLDRAYVRIQELLPKVG